MKGSSIALIRKWLGLDPFAMAAALGVHVSTVYRWEATQDAKVDQLQHQILEGLLPHTDPKQFGDSRGARQKVGEDLGRRVCAAIVSKGSLAGLHTVLEFLLKGES